jgi:hypothetical protein
VCTHRILLEENHKPSIEHQWRLNPNLQEVVKKKILKLLEANVIYPISDSKWVSHVHVVPKKGGATEFGSEKEKLIQTHVAIGCIMCIDYRKLNTTTWKDHFPLPFVDQLLERLANHSYFYYLDRYSGFFQVSIHPQTIFHKAMMAIFSDFKEKEMKVFMDDFSVYDTSFDSCLANLCKNLQRCEEVNLVLNWEKCHFMVQEGIVLGHLMTSREIEVDKAKIEVIEKLEFPNDVKGVKSFLGHCGFIEDSSRISHILLNP